MKLLTMRTLIMAVCSLLLSTALYAAEMVNINKADAAAIQQNLVGIGPVKAEAIVRYRKKNGKFGSVSDLQSVEGIGPALLKKNKRYLSTSKGVVKGDSKKYAASKKQAASKSASSSKKKSSSSSSKKSTSKSSTAKKSSTAAKPAKKSTSKSSTTKKSTSKKSTSKKSTSKKKTTKPKKKSTSKKKKKAPAS